MKKWSRKSFFLKQPNIAYNSGMSSSYNSKRLDLLTVFFVSLPVPLKGLGAINGGCEVNVSEGVFRSEIWASWRPCFRVDRWFSAMGRAGTPFSSLFLLLTICFLVVQAFSYPLTGFVQFLFVSLSLWGWLSFLSSMHRIGYLLII